MEEAVSEQYKKDLRDQMLQFKNAKEKELQKKQEEFNRREQELMQASLKQESDYTRRLNEERSGWQKNQEAEKARLQQTLESSLRKSIGTDFENKLNLLEEANRNNEEKLSLPAKRTGIPAKRTGTEK